MALSKAAQTKWEKNFVSGGKVTGLSGRMAARTGARGKRSTKAGRRAERIQQSKQGDGRTVGGSAVIDFSFDVDY